MKTIKNLFAIVTIFAIFISGNLYAQQTTGETADQNIDFSNYKRLDLSEKIINTDSHLEFDETLNKMNRVESDSKEKSPVLGALFSAVIPGTGEIYSKSYIKGAIFLAAEIGLWTLYAIKQGDGNNQTDEYQAYADANWDVYKYAQWLKDENFEGAEGIDLSADRETLRGQLNAVENINFSHSLPNYGDQQYYEVIGKYQSFIAGWVFSSGVTKSNYLNYRPTQVDDYMGVRQSANDSYDFASTTLNVVILNHVLSAADAAWTVTMFNKDLRINTSVKMKNMYSYEENREVMVPFGNFSVNF